MVWAQLVLVGGLCLAAGPDDPEAWVRQLGAPRYAERQAAVEALRAIGSPALPALRAASQSPDAEVRARAVELIGQIEAEALVRPTTVRLDFENAPLADVVATLSERTGIAMALLPENSPIWRSQRLTLQAAEPVTFWQALDQLCGAAGLRDMVAQGASVPGRDAAVQLFAGGPVASPVVDLSGPFRVTAEGIHYHLDRNFGANPNNRVVRNGVLVPQGGDDVIRQFYLDLKIEVEPRLLLSGNGALELTEAVDDQGNSLLLPESPETVVRDSGFFGVGRTTTTLQLQAHMHYPDRPGASIARLAGKVPAVIAARREDPLIIELDQSKGKTYETRDVALEVHDIQDDPVQHRTTIELTLRPLNPGDPTLGGAANQLGVELMAFRSPNTPQSQLEIVDAQGRQYRQWFPTSTRVDQDRAQISLTLMDSGNEVGPPAQIRFYDMNRANTVVEFEFRDIPMF